VGFRVVDEIVTQFELEPPIKQDESLVYRWRRGDREILLVKPLTYMNSSGRAVRLLMSRYSIEPAHILVVFDDAHLELGKLRIRPKGGDGGHKGMKSVIEWLETEEFPRLRIGIGQPPQGMDMVEYVLSEFSPEEEEVIEAAIERAVEAILFMLDHDIEGAMNKFNPMPPPTSLSQRTPPPESPESEGIAF